MWEEKSQPKNNSFHRQRQKDVVTSGTLDKMGKALETGGESSYEYCLCAACFSIRNCHTCLAREVRESSNARRRYIFMNIIQTGSLGLSKWMFELLGLANLRIFLKMPPPPPFFKLVTWRSNNKLCIFFNYCGFHFPFLFPPTCDFNIWMVLTTIQSQYHKLLHEQLCRIPLASACPRSATEHDLCLSDTHMHFLRAKVLMWLTRN